VVRDDLIEVLRGLKNRRRVLQDRLSPREAYAVYASVWLNHSQSKIGKRLGIKQPSVTYTLRRALDRLQFVSRYPFPSRAKVNSALRGSGLDVKALARFLECGSQSEAGAAVGRSQGYVRHQALLAYETLPRNGPVWEALHMLLVDQDGASLLWRTRASKKGASMHAAPRLPARLPPWS